jgi:hypothetical protein
MIGYNLDDLLSLPAVGTSPRPSDRRGSGHSAAMVSIIAGRDTAVPPRSWHMSLAMVVIVVVAIIKVLFHGLGGIPGVSLIGSPS